MHYTPVLSSDEIRVIAPSDSLKAHRQGNYDRAQKRLEALGYTVTYGDYIDSKIHLGTGHAHDRATDFNNAFNDPNVKAIICLHGGFAANELLPHIDWDTVRQNPKPLVGYSDITVLVNAIYAKTGQTAFLGPNLGTIGSEDDWEYSLDNLVAALQGVAPRTLQKSATWFDDGVEVPAAPWNILHTGEGSGILLGGNISTFYLLQGTEYQPSFDTDFILALEDDGLLGDYTIHGFSRSFESILQLPNVRKNLKGLLIGRFETASNVQHDDLVSVITAKQLGDIPVLSNIDFGHTRPMLTLPIGGTLSVEANDSAHIKIVSY